MTVIALDAMGGDFAPRIPVEAALRIAREGVCNVVLVGDQEQLEAELDRHKSPRDGLRIHHTSEWIEMGESPVEALRRKRQASIRVAFDLVANGEASAAVSAGHSGAMMVAGKLALDTIPGIDRPAIATPLPHKRGVTLLLDSGANVDCKPPFLVQFAHMGAIYARAVLDTKNPQVALLSNGAEAGKGNELTRQAYALLEQEPINFLGYLEPKDMFRGKADVIVCDGFIGNLVLKTAEAASVEVRLLLKESTFRGPLTRIGFLLLRRFFLDLARRTDYREIGGSLLLGLRGGAVVCHGASNARTVYNAIRLATRCGEHGLTEALNQSLSGTGSPKTKPGLAGK